jgi:autotransporter-associated beta strand protein
MVESGRWLRAMTAGGRCARWMKGENMERMPARAPLARSVMLGLCVMGVVGCGGGGGGGNVRSDPPPPAPTSPNPPVTPAPPSPSVVTERYAHWRLINHSVGSDLGTDGVIGVVSTGVSGDAAELAGRPVRQFTYVDAATNDLGVADKAGVGTDLARVLLERPGELSSGIALANGANIVSARLVPDAMSNAALGDSQAAPSRLRTMHDDLVSAGVNVMLNAWGRTPWSDAATTDAYVSAYRPFVVDHDGLMVFAAGDQASTQPSTIAALPGHSANAAVLEGGWLTVAALDTLVPTRLAPYANACGDAARFCMVAPGDLALAASAGNSSAIRSVNGSAFAAAQVAGAAASLREKFPYMSANQIRQILLGNAVDLGAPGADATFGWGLLDFDRSMRGPAKLLWGDFEVTIPAGTHSVWWNDMSGPASVIVGSDEDTAGTLESASLRISGNNTFTGSMHIKSGLTVSINGTMTAPITVDDGAYFYAWEVTLRAPVMNRGVMQVNSSFGDQVHTFLEGDVTNEGVLVNREQANTRLMGNLFLKPSGTFMVNALGNDPLRVKGRIEIAGDLYIADLAEGYVARNRTEILVGEGGITGQFANAYSAPMLDATIGYDAHTVWLDVARIDARGVQGVTYSPASFGAAQRVERAFGRLDDIVLSSPAGALPTAFSAAAAQLQGAANAAAVERSLDSLSGELHDADGAFALMAADGNRNAIESRVDALGQGIAAGAWSQSLDGIRQWSAFDVSTNGWMLGFDQRGNDGMTIGASLSETSGDAWHSQRFDRERNRQVDGQLYASWRLDDDAYVLGAVAFGHMQRWLQREVLLGDEAYRVSSDYAHRYGALSLQTGRNLRFGTGTVTPYIGAQALRLDRDGFSEEGASGFGLTSDDASMSALQALAGARWTYAWRGDATRWSLSGRIEWQHLLSQSGTQIQARFTGMDAWAPIVADGLDRNVGLFGLGLEAGIGRRTSLRFDLDSRRSDGEQWNGAMATWSTAF